MLAADYPKLSDLLSYEEAVAMKALTLESQRESRYMYHLTVGLTAYIFIRVISLFIGEKYQRCRGG